jgi:hypothetical protein
VPGRWAGASLETDYRSSGSVQAISFSDGASIGGSSRRSNLHFLPSSATGSESVLERANVTGNSVTQSGAATVFDTCDILRFQFCEIRSNVGSNCITIWRASNALIRCISVRSNTADSSYAYRQGLFFVNAVVTISESAIAGNSAQFLVHSSASCSITFSDCHFDNSSPTASVAIFSTVNCATDAAVFPGLPAVCLSRTHSPNPSATPSTSVTPTTPFIPSRSLLRTGALPLSSGILSAAFTQTRAISGLSFLAKSSVFAASVGFSSFSVGPK